MKNLFEMKKLIADVVGEEGAALTEEQNQLMDVVLLPSGVLRMSFYSNDGSTLRSRIALNLTSARAVELFSDNGVFYQLRVDGGQVPLVLSLDDGEKFMYAAERVFVRGA